MLSSVLLALAILVGSVTTQDNQLFYDDGEVGTSIQQHNQCNEAEISHCLCGMNQSFIAPGRQIVISFTAKIKYSFDPQNTCIISNITSLQLVGKHGIPQIKCNSNSSNRIIIFSQVEILRLENIHLSGCGDAIPADLQSHRQIENGQQAVMYMLNSETIVLSRVNITDYQGYGVLIVQVHRVVIDHLQVSDTKCCEIGTNITCSCSGLVITSYKTHNATKSGFNLSLQNSKFYGNVNVYYPNYTSSSLCNTLRSISKGDGGVVQPVSASFTLILDQIVINKIVLNRNEVSNNAGIKAAGILIALNTVHSLVPLPQFHINITNNYFKRNTLVSPQYCMGSSISVTLSTTTTMAPGNVDKNDEKISTNNISKVTIYMYNNTVIRHKNRSAIFVLSSKHIQLLLNVTELYCKYNTVSYNGVCMQAKVERTDWQWAGSGTFSQIYLNSIKASHNCQIFNSIAEEDVIKRMQSSFRTALFTFINIPHVEITGTPSNPTHFYQNNASFLISLQSRVTLTGTIIFEDISYSPVLYSGGSSYLILKSKLNMSFIGQYESNIEQAIIQATNDPGSTIESPCALQIQLQQQCWHLLSYDQQSCMTQLRDSYNIKLFNSSILDIIPAYNCMLMENQAINMAPIYEQVFGNGTVVRSNAIKVYYMEVGDKPKTGIVRYSSDIYPGYHFKLCLALMDYVGNIIPGTIEIKAANYKKYSARNKLYIMENKTSLLLMLYSLTHCTEYPLKVYSYDDNDPILPLRLIISESGMQPTLILDITTRGCPKGFILIDGKCECGYFMQKIQEKHPYDNTHCFIKRIKINETSETKYSALFHNTQFFWLGFANKETVTHTSQNWTGESILLYSAICPFGYCNSTRDYVDLMAKNDLCIGNREGQLCSKCQENYSLVFNYNHCVQCSNTWLWTIPMYGLLGIVLVIVLLVFNLTISHGPVSSIILFSNIVLFAQSGIRELSLRDNDFYMTVIVSFVNLKIGYPMCLYNGMTITVKTCMELVFPIYTWLLVALIIVASRNSTLISNWIADRSVQVLVTIWHLSYIKILITVVNIFTPLQALVENKETRGTQTVWLWNIHPGIPYGTTWEHIIPLVIGTLFLVLYIIPYLFLSMYVPFCWHKKWIIRFRPVFETMYGPYKRKYSIWFGVRLTTVTILAVISVLIKGSNMHFVLLLYHLTLILLLLTQAFISPFKNKLVAAIDLIFLLDSALLYILITYEVLHDLMDYIFVTAFVLYLVMMVLSGAIVTYHCITYVRPVNVYFHLIINRLKQCRAFRKLLKMFDNNDYERDREATLRYSRTNNAEDNNLREPLLSDLSQ